MPGPSDPPLQARPEQYPSAIIPPDDGGVVFKALIRRTKMTSFNTSFSNEAHEGNQLQISRDEAQPLILQEWRLWVGRHTLRGERRGRATARAFFNELQRRRAW